MTTSKLRPADLPGWPRFLSRELAAAYVGVSPNVFDAEVERGIWPKAVARGSKLGRLTWDREKIDAAVDRLSGASHAQPDELGGLQWSASPSPASA